MPEQFCYRCEKSSQFSKQANNIYMCTNCGFIRQIKGEQIHHNDPVKLIADEARRHAEAKRRKY